MINTEKIMKHTVLYMILAAGFLAMPSQSVAQKVYSLEQCRKMALDNNIKVRDSQLGIAQAKEQEKEAYTKYFPTVTAGATYFRSSDDLIQEKVSLSATDQQQLAQAMAQLGLDPTKLAALPTSYTLKALDHGTMANVLAMQPIYAGGQIVNGNKLAKLQTQVRSLQLRQSTDEVVRTTDGYYYQLLTLYDKQKTLDVVDAQLVSIHNDAQNAFNAGVANKNDLLSVELKQNEIATARLKLDNGISLCTMVLAQYMGVPTEKVMIDTTLAANLPVPSTYLVNHDEALNNRVEAQLLDKSVEAADLQKKIKQGSMLPTVGLGVMGYYQNMSNAGHLNMVGLVNVTVPISDWWSSNHNVRRLQIAARQARNDRDDARQLLLIQMQSAYNDLNNAYKQVDLARKSIEKAEENLRLNQDYYKAGTSTMSNLLDAETQNREARDQYVDAVTQYLYCRTNYFIATGRDNLE